MCVGGGGGGGGVVVDGRCVCHIHVIKLGLLLLNLKSL